MFAAVIEILPASPAGISAPVSSITLNPVADASILLKFVDIKSPFTEIILIDPPEPLPEVVPDINDKSLSISP